MSAQPVSGVSRLLTLSGVITEEQSKKIIDKTNDSKLSFVHQLVQDKFATSNDVAKAIAKALNLPLLDIASCSISPKIDVLPIESMEKFRAVPLLVKGKTLFIGMSDPTTIHTLDSIQFKSGLTFSPIVVLDDQISKAIKMISEAKGIDISAQNYDGLDELGVAEEESNDEEISTNDADDAPVVKFIQKTLLDAIKMGASDLHFEPYEKYYRIRYRIDGILTEISKPPLAIKDKIASRIKVISGMDIAEKRVPQDGRTRLQISKTKAIDFRVSSLPMLQGEKIVMRILDPSSATLGIDALGYEPEQRKALLDAVSRPYGMVLVTGPTGSGKTVSLYTCLNILNQPGINISTAEDPAEINLPGINQVNVNDKAGLTFAAALKAFLRQDPDIIMVGEIRDLETADISIKAAQTGHMVLSTLHTNDAPTTLSRLMNMGVAPFNIASAVNLITAQRLARRLCKECKEPISLPKDVLMSVGFSQEQVDSKWQLYGPKEGGCPACNGMGYKGRVGIYQVMPISEEMARIIMQNGTAIDIADQAKKEGVKDLRQSGILKIMQGLTSIEEVESCTNL